MPLPADSRKHSLNIRVDPSFVEAEALEELRLKVEATCEHACDLRSFRLQLLNRLREVVAYVELTEFDGRLNKGEVILRAPLEPGDHELLLVFPECEACKATHTEATATVIVRVRPHRVILLAWDVPSPVEACSRFRTKVGAKCLANCTLSGAAIGVRDHEGRIIATGTLGRAPWPGTEALYWTEVELAAPEREGRYAWTVELYGLEGHCYEPYAFSFIVTSRPEYEVRVTVVDSTVKAPVAGAEVSLGPFTTIADEKGVAVFRVPKGTWKLVAWKRLGDNILLGEMSVEVTSNVSLVVEVSPVSLQPYVAMQRGGRT